MCPVPYHPYDSPAPPVLTGTPKTSEPRWVVIDNFPEIGFVETSPDDPPKVLGLIV